MSPVTALPPADFSPAAWERLRKPLRRGRFQPIDAARAGLAPASAADGQGQARIYLLVDADTHVIEDARFLAFGELASHALTDVFCDTIRGMPLAALADLQPAQFEAQLRDDPATPAVPGGADAAAFLGDLLAGAQAAADDLQVPPPPSEKPRYERKREQDWDDKDRAWLPQSLLVKIRRATEVADAALHERLDLPAGSGEITGLHDDFQVHLRINADLSDEQRATAGLFVESALRAHIHPAMSVTLAATTQGAPA